MKKHCPWPKEDPLYLDYHDHEWGVPVHDDQKLFEMLILEGMQAGLSWITVLRKRDHFRQAFDNFEAEKIARYSAKKTETLLNNPGIIRNRLKITAAIKNAHGVLAIQEKHGSLNQFLWQFTQGKPLQNHWQSSQSVPAYTKESDQMAKELKRLGFNFVGTTICYAFMQAVGMVNDHLIECYRHKELLMTK